MVSSACFVSGGSCREVELTAAVAAGAAGRRAVKLATPYLPTRVRFVSSPAIKFLNAQAIAQTARSS